MSSMTLDVMDDGRIIIDADGYQGQTCMKDLSFVLEQLKAVGIDGALIDQKRKNSMLANKPKATVKS